MLLDQGIDSLIGSFFSGSGGAAGGGGLQSILGGLFGGFRASGGPVATGRAYVVGEKGPEIFSPGRSGTIMSNASLRAPDIRPASRASVINMGSTSVVVNGNADSVTVKQLQAALELNRKQSMRDVKSNFSALAADRDFRENR